MDGVRLNQPFGDVVSWDLIPRIAIFSGALMPGSNPLFGLNTLGGALSIQTKDGRNAPGHDGAGDLRQRRAPLARVRTWRQPGQQRHATGTWRETSSPRTAGATTRRPTSRQVFGKLGWRRDRGDVSVTLAYADNSLTGNGLQEIGFLDRDYSSVYTKPDKTDNRSTFLNVTARRTHQRPDRRSRATPTSATSAPTRSTATSTRTRSTSRSISRAPPSRRRCCAAGYISAPGESAPTPATRRFPIWRCVGNVLLNDEPAEKCNGLINRTRDAISTTAASPGRSRCAMPRRPAQSASPSARGFDRQQRRLHPVDRARLSESRSQRHRHRRVRRRRDRRRRRRRAVRHSRRSRWQRHRPGASSRPTRCRSASAWHLTLSGRFNRTTVDNTDLITPGGEPGSLDGDHVFSRFNPAVGVTFDRRRLASTCMPATAKAAAPPRRSSSAAPILRSRASCRMRWPAIHRSTRSSREPWKPGVRGSRRGVTWNAGFFHAQNDDDILFVTSEQTGFGYFRNFGETRRQGIELGVERAASGASRSAPATRSSTRRSRARRPSTVRATAPTTRQRRVNRVSRARSRSSPAIGCRSFRGTCSRCSPTSRSRAPSTSTSTSIGSSSSCRARQREQPARTGRDRTTSGAGTSPGYAVVNLGGRYSADALAAGHRADQQSVRSRATTRRRSSVRSGSPTAKRSSRGRSRQ